MAQLIVTVDDAYYKDMTVSLAANGGYQPTVDDGSGNQIPNPQSAEDFAHQRVIDWIKQQVKEYQTMLAKEQAAATVAKQVDAIEVSIK